MLMHLRCFFLLKIVKIYALLVCKIFCLKIRSCKFFDKSQVCSTAAISPLVQHQRHCHQCQRHNFDDDHEIRTVMMMMVFLKLMMMMRMVMMIIKWTIMCTDVAFVEECRCWPKVPSIYKYLQFLSDVYQLSLKIQGSTITKAFSC